MTCKHNWEFTDGSTGALKCTRCGAVTGPRTYGQLVQDMLQDVTVIGSAWSKGGERIDPMGVYKDFEPSFKLHDSRPANTIQFYGGPEPRTEVLRISKDGIWANPDIPCDEAAKKVLEAIDGYVKGMVERVRQEELGKCCDLLEGMHAATDGNHNYYLHAANELRKLRSGK
jgi:hypothetical protein